MPRLMTTVLLILAALLKAEQAYDDVAACRR
jgi:hypothetical protein